MGGWLSGRESPREWVERFSTNEVLHYFLTREQCNKDLVFNGWGKHIFKHWTLLFSLQALPIFFTSLHPIPSYNDRHLLVLVNISKPLFPCFCSPLCFCITSGWKHNTLIRGSLECPNAAYWDKGNFRSEILLNFATSQFQLSPCQFCFSNQTHESLFSCNFLFPHFLLNLCNFSFIFVLVATKWHINGINIVQMPSNASGIVAMKFGRMNNCIQEQKETVLSRKSEERN